MSNQKNNWGKKYQRALKRNIADRPGQALLAGFVLGVTFGMAAERYLVHPIAVKYVLNDLQGPTLHINK